MKTNPKTKKKTKKLKLFVWEGVLEDYTPGIAFALAENVDSARKQIIKKDDCVDMSDLMGEPSIITKPEGFTNWGGG